MTTTHGALQAFLAIVAGAFGAHGLEKILDAYGLGIWHTAATYHMYHALALVALGLWERQTGKNEKLVHSCFSIGIFLFSGSLYLLALTGVKWLGAITPLGGTAFLVGWLVFAWHARKKSA